ncbi:Mov34/MPN/PAD-1 family protein [Candidatus Promineifilum breve]|uniref:Mov34/MPN/PAD-1 family protein n=1 Tax=Candidatus Promineifilum breve TaxID=1806508 RepID=UPI0012FFA86B|nr:M67 family metallopeptidase [Candidatus Promineifilum breve]
MSSTLRNELIAHATALLPEEACGLLAGRDGQATRFYPVENMRHSPVAYDMEPRALVQAILAIEAEELELLAIYHSHPSGPAWPSTTDIAQAYYPEQAYLILSLRDPARPELRAFMLNNGRAREIALES